MRVGRRAATVALIVLIAGACTSEHGALPPPTAPPTAPPTPTPSPTIDGVAPRALLQVADLPAGFTEQEIDAAQRWAETLNVTSELNPLRPDCTDPLAAITATLGATPPDAAGVAFSDGDGRGILQFTGVGDPAAARVLVEQIAALNASCDAYTLQVPDSGSLAVSVAVLDLPGLATDEDVVTTLWRSTLLSEHLRLRNTYAAVAAGGVVSLLGLTGDPPLSDAELTDVVDAAVERAEEAAR